MNTLFNICFSLHNHQPSNNFDSIFKDATNFSYLPFLKLLLKKPKIKVTLHYSGSLLDWFEINQPEIIEIIRELVDRKQIELLSSPIYEPILTIIPPEDRIGQIEAMSEKLNNLFGIEANGLWIPERVWEPELCDALDATNIDYILLDDSHLYNSGYFKEIITGYYNTENNGIPLKVFPISSYFRYSIPFKPVENVIETITTLSTSSNSKIITIADDGEKFGLWPGTFDHSYKNGYLEELFEKIDEIPNIKFSTFSDVIEEIPPVSNIYIPSGSYKEMSKWSLPVSGIKELDNLYSSLNNSEEIEIFSKFTRIGFFKNFLKKYSEVNKLHKKMLRTSALVNSMRESKKKKKALDYLYRAEEGSPYWHGLYCGVYSPFLRSNAYSNLIKAEKSTISDTNYLFAYEEDLNFDSINELIIETELFTLYLIPQKGGVCSELDYKPLNLNLCNCMTSRVEPYHKPNSINYDWYEKNSFIHHFFSEDITIDNFINNNFKENSDFTIEPFKYGVKHNKKRADILFERNGGIWKDNDFLPHILQEKIKIESGKNIIDFTIILKNDSMTYMNYTYGMEFNFNFLSLEDEKLFLNKKNKNYGENLYKAAICKKGDFFNISSDSNEFEINFESELQFELVKNPIITHSKSERGIEKIIQGVTLIPLFKFSLMPSGIKTLNFKLSFISREKK